MSAVRGEGGCPVWTFCKQGGEGFFRCRRLKFLAQKPGFFEIYGVSAWTRGRGLS